MTESLTHTEKQTTLLRSAVLTGALLVAVGGAGIALRGSAAEVAHMIPAPVVDGAPAATSEVAVLAGGCFWGVQDVFQHVNGVINAVSGYAGGEQKTAHYEIVGSGATGHAESVHVTFDPSKISYGRILQIYFSVASTARQSSRRARSRRGSGRLILRSSIRRASTMPRSSLRSNRVGSSTR